MRRIFVAVAGLLFVAGALPAAAGHKTIKESYEARAVPFPVGSYDDGEGCIHGVDMVHKVTTPFAAPFSGTLTVEIKQLTGDWDLFITDAEGEVKTESSGDSGQPEKASLRLKSKQEVNIVVCNWAGEPQVTVDYTFRHI